MSRDGLLPAIFSRVDPRYQTPFASTWIAALVVGIPAGIWDIGTFADLSNIGTLFAFIVVSLGVLISARKAAQPTVRVRGSTRALHPANRDLGLPGAHGCAAS